MGIGTPIMYWLTPTAASIPGITIFPRTSCATTIAGSTEPRNFNGSSSSASGSEPASSAKINERSNWSQASCGTTHGDTRVARSQGMPAAARDQETVKRTRARILDELPDKVLLTRMKTDLEQIEDQARALSAEERAKLAESMLESLHAPLSDIESAWAEEVERRVAAFDHGEMPSYPAEDVFAEARRFSR